MLCATFEGTLAMKKRELEKFFTRARFTAGDFGGRCFRATCRATGASWHHRRADRYYCEDCATDINLACRIKGVPPLCARHGLGLSRSY
jgi:hypothetical protein